MTRIHLKWSWRRLRNVSRELSKQEQSIENSTDAASADLKRLLGEREADSLKKIELKQNSLKNGSRLNKSAVDEELKNLVEHESKIDSASKLLGQNSKNLGKRVRKPRKKCMLNWRKRRSKRRRQKVC